MDKKKVKELIDKTIRFTKATDDEYIQGNVKSHIINALQEALEELSKSDWVSVEDGLPEYGDMVWVRSKENTQLVWSSYRTKNKAQEVDENCFLKPAVLEIPITHWKPVEKLEE